MGKKYKRVNAYIADSAAFAKLLLEKLRSPVHSACPEVEDTIKWVFAAFNHKGIVCSMASFNGSYGLRVKRYECF